MRADPMRHAVRTRDVQIHVFRRGHFVADAVGRMAHFAVRTADARQAIQSRVIDHEERLSGCGDHTPKIARWSWGRVARSGAV